MDPTRSGSQCARCLTWTAHAIALGVALGVQWEVDRSMRRLWTTDTICKGKRKARTSDWPDWYSDDDGGTNRIPGSFVHTVVQDATCSSNATETWTSHEIEVRIMLGQDPTNEDIGESASLKSSSGAFHAP